MIQSTPVMSQTLPAQRVSPCPPAAWAYSTGVHRPPAPDRLRPRRRRRRSRPERFAPLGRGRADRARGGRRTSAAKHEPAAASVARAVGGRVGARRLRRDARAALRRRAQARQPAALRAHLPRRRRDRDGDARSRGRAAPGARTAPTTLPVSTADAHLRPPARHGRACRWSRRRTAPAVDWRAPLVVPRPAPRARSCARDDAARSAATSSRATARRWPRARTACPTSGRWPPRSPAASARRRPSAPPSSPAAACPTARRSASTGSSASSTSGSPAAPAASCAPARASSRSAEARDGADVRSAIDPDIQRAAVEALAGRFGGIAVLRPATGEVLGLSGHRVLRAPAAGLDVQDHHARRRARGRQGQAERAASRCRRRPTIEGVELQNAHGEACGGSLQALVRRLVQLRLRPAGRQARRQAARRDRRALRLQPGRRGPIGAARSTIPAADEIGDDLAVGSSAIGQGKVLATPLELADRGRDDRDARPPRRADALARRRRASRRARRASARARVIARFMRAVVTVGHRRRRRGPGRQGGGQDRHRRAAQHGQRGPGAGRAGRRVDPAARGGQDRHRRVVRRLRALPAARGSRSRCCSSGQGAGGETAAPAARRPCIRGRGRLAARRRGRRCRPSSGCRARDLELERAGSGAPRW